MDGKVLVWSKGSSIDDARIIWIRGGRMYISVSQPDQALVHDEIYSSELWHQRYGHLHFRAFHELSEIVLRVPELQVKNDGVCKCYALGKNIKEPFPNSDKRSKEVLDLVHSDVCGPMPMVRCTM